MSMTKAKGLDIIAFWNEWPMGKDWYVEDAEIDVVDESGAVALDPEETYDLDAFGVLCWQGNGDCPPGPGPTFAREFRKWSKARSHVSLTVDVPKEQADEFRALCKSHGWTCR